MKKILVVDDQADVREVICELLNMHGFDTISAENGQTALRIFYQYIPDAAIVDLEMPVMNGIQFTRKVIADRPDFPIIVISGFVHKHTPEFLHGLGIKKIIAKPIDLKYLFSAVEDVLMQV